MSSLSDSDRTVVLATLEELTQEPPPRNWAGPGCVMALPGFVLLLIFPLIGRRFDIPGGVATLVLVVGGILMVTGLILWFTAGGIHRGRAIAAAEAALRTLEGDEDDRHVLLRAATLLLYNAYATYGPSTGQSFDFEEGRRRLGGRLELVMSVEEVLLEGPAIYPVFTGDASAPEDHGASSEP